MSKDCQLSFRNKAWSPYVVGVLIGLLQIPAFMLIHTALGASSSFVTAAADILRVFDPAVGEIKYAAKHFDGGKNFWQLTMVISIALGAFISAYFSKSLKKENSPVWNKALKNYSKGKRFLMAFIGGFVVLMGSRIADGCTSGHGVSGIAQLAIGSTVAIVFMFVGGFITAKFFNKI
ncbi:MAG: YeeE/YedE thiosulfate transporter family protein [Alphaproteobacteria bacterium]